MITGSKIIVAVIVMASHVCAHSLWVNSFESFSHQPGHTTLSLGWGHTLPIDDGINSPNGQVMIETFSIRSPNGQLTALAIPSSEPKEPTQKSVNFDLYDADIGLQKVALKKESEKGVYQIEAKSKPTYYTEYIDTAGKKRLKLTAKDVIKDIQSVLMSIQYEAFAKTYLTLGKWESPRATGKGIEIIPKTDLSNVKVGDLVEFEVLFYGKPLNVGIASMDYISASSSTFGQSEGFALMSYVQEGKARIRVQSAGQWIVSCLHKDPVTQEGDLKALYGKVDYVVNAASITFNVKN